MKTLKPFLNRKKIVAVTVILLFAVVGVILLFISKAATPNASIEAEGGTQTGVIATTDNKASGSSYIQFGTKPTSGGGTITGASLAICSPAACTAGTVPSNSVNVVDLGPVNDGSGASPDRTYGYYIPKNLLHDGSAQGKPAAVFDLSRTGCGVGAASGEYQNSQMAPVADTNKFMIIYLECPTGATAWLHPETDCGGAGGVTGKGSCDSSSAPSDNPYIKAAVADATTRFNIDPVRRYLVGGSSAANMSRDAICSRATTPHNSTLFRGIMTMGGGANALLNTTSGVCPSGDKTTFYLELSGKNTQADPYNTIVIPPTGAGDHTILGFDATRAWWASYLGNCAAPVHSNTGSGVLSDVYNYTCTDANSTSPFFEAVAVTNGGHMWCGLDTNVAQNCITSGTTCTNNSAIGCHNTGGWSTASFTWNFFAHTSTN